MSSDKIIFIFLFSYNIIIVIALERHLVNDLFDGLYTKEIYSGYLNTDINGTELFYVFTPSQSSPQKDPVLLWLNGGPGSSSTIGLLEQVGPVIFIPHKKQPIINDYAWNKNANVIFLESPGGVGFSKVNDKNFFYDDEIQAISLNIAIQNFFQIFPEYQKNSFFITGLSYSGTYIPHLVNKMFKYFEENSDAIKLNLKGILIGNPYTYEDTDFEDSIIEFGFSHGLISIETFEKYLKECAHWPQVEKILKSYRESDNYIFDPIINEDELMPWKNVTKACNEARNETKNAFEGINFYGILKECPSNETIFELKKEFENIDYDEINLHSEQNAFKNMINKKINEKYLIYTQGNRNLKNSEEYETDEEYEYAIDYVPTCNINKYTPNFLNNETIKEKLGVDKSIKHQRFFATINYKWGDSKFFYTNDIKELYEKKKFSTWLYSGTEDMAVTTLGTLRFINELNYKIKKKWRKWVVDGQVAGMEQSYDYGFKFITVKGAGHYVTEDQPKASKILLDKFIEFNSYEINDDNDNSFPVWAIVLIIVSVLMIILVVGFVIMRKRGNKSRKEIEDESKLLPSVTNQLN